MTARWIRHWKLALLWAISLIVVGVVSSSAQGRRPGSTAGDNLLITDIPVVVSGNDIGFRIERTRDGIPIGKVVIRLNGTWMDTNTIASPR